LRKEDRVIARIWHGYTKPEHANAYERMLKPELLPGISKVKGYRGSYLLRFQLVPARIPHNPCGSEASCYDKNITPGRFRRIADR
jgi:hypothetical protein